ncbi:hypothetical protein [Geomesophilobacter sediminis]|uniref:Uncharacterized protein n=1 Tax=Geomesophilobacter sediminis TaxID=2798584 RepID=A0A8J7JLW6_9BACT|nr:hypothetical protein [Geomesophilobacter sediminis]MBJ6725330.1 hypothetical protein [Geomesophilobacter sediminis]
MDHRKQPGDAPNNSTEFNLDYSKRILPNFGLEFHDAYQRLDGAGATSGWENLSVGGKWQFFTSEQHETILSLGTDVEIGGTGARRIAENTSTVSPALFFGKGMGDLPDSASFLKPFAVTGAIGPDFPIRSENPATFSWGFTLQYSLQYLQSYVKDVGLGAPFNRMTLVTEFPMQTDVDTRQTTGTVNPGIVWMGKSVEFGVAAEIPINARSGNSIGVMALFHLFLDDLFPNSIGRPIFP